MSGTTLGRRYLPADLQAEFDSRFDGVVVVQGECIPSQAIAEVEWLGQLGSPLIRGVVAYAPLETPAALDAVRRCAESPMVVGVRRNIQDEPDGFATDPAFVDGVRFVGDVGLPFDACVRQHQLRDVVELAQVCGQTSIVLDHLGKPAVGGDGWTEWCATLRRLAAVPTTYCKLSGLATEAPVFDAARTKPYLEEALTAFGPVAACSAATGPYSPWRRRTVSGSNWCWTSFQHPTWMRSWGGARPASTVWRHREHSRTRHAVARLPRRGSDVGRVGAAVGGHARR